jgi:hypothetical protein
MMFPDESGIERRTPTNRPFLQEYLERARLSKDGRFVGYIDA